MTNDPLHSWRDTPVKQSITDFVSALTNPDLSTNVAEIDRIAVFDNDGSLGATEFRMGDTGPELVKGVDVQLLDDGPAKPISMHQHVGQRPILGAGTDQLLAATTEGNWSVIDMAADWETVYPTSS